DSVIARSSSDRCSSEQTLEAFMRLTSFVCGLSLLHIACGANDLSLGKGPADAQPGPDGTAHNQVDGGHNQADGAAQNQADASVSGDASSSDASVAPDSNTLQGVPVSFVVQNIGNNQNVTLLRNSDLTISVTEPGKSQETWVNPWFYVCNFICDPAECAGYTDVTTDSRDVGPGQELRVTWDGIHWASRQKAPQTQCEYKSLPPQGTYHVHWNERCGATTFCPKSLDFAYPPSGDVVIQTLSYPDHR